MARNFKYPIYYAVDFEENSANIQTYDTLPEKGHVIEICSKDDDGRGNGDFPVRFYVDGQLSSWKTDFLKVTEMKAGYTWQDISIYFVIRDKRGDEVKLIGNHSRFNLEEGIISLMQKWADCKKFHFTDTIKVYNEYHLFTRRIIFFKAEKWISESLLVSFKRDMMKIDEYIKSTILSCMENGYTIDIEYLQEVRNALKQKLWDFQLEPEEKK